MACRAMLASGKAVQYQPPPISVRTITRHVGVNERAGMEYYCASLVPVRAACGDWLRPLYIRGTGAHPLGGFSYIRSFAPPNRQQHHTQKDHFSTSRTELWRRPQPITCRFQFRDQQMYLAPSSCGRSSCLHDWAAVSRTRVGDRRAQIAGCGVDCRHRLSPGHAHVKCTSRDALPPSPATSARRGLPTACSRCARAESVW